MQVSGMKRGTTATHVQAVLAIDDRVLRNYWVTQTYSDLAAGLTQLLQANTANWCTFGTWASDTVGRNIRGEDLPKWLHDARRPAQRHDGRHPLGEPGSTGELALGVPTRPSPLITSWASSVNFSVRAH